MRTPKKPGEQPAAKTAAVAPAFRIERNTKRRRYLKLLIYGPYGVGKTTLAATSVESEEMCDVLMINAEGGDLVLEEDRFQNIDIVPVRTVRQLSSVYEYLRQHCLKCQEGDEEWLRTSQAKLFGMEEDQIGEGLEMPLRKYRTVMIDTLSELERYVMDHILGIADTARLDEDVPPEEWAEYKKNHHMVQRLIRKFRDLPMNIIFTCAQQFVQDESKKQKYMPDMTGKLANKVQGFMDMVGYYASTFEDDKRIRVLFVEPSPQGKYDAKHRYAKFKGDRFKEPTLGGILKQVGLLDPEGAAIKA